MKHLLPVVLIGLTLLSAAAAAQDLLSRVSEQLSSDQHIDGRFTQARDVSFLSKPLISRGSFSIDSQAGLQWLVEEPVRSEMRVRDQEVLLDGVPVEDPGIGQFIAMILESFVTRDLSPVAQRFEVTGEVAPALWNLQLVPRQWLLRKAIARVELTGDQFLHSVVVHEPDGSATRVTFADSAGQPLAPKVQVGSGS